MRTRHLIAFFLLIPWIGFAQAPKEQTGSCAGCFSEPQSTLLFSSLIGAPNFGEFTLVTPNGNFTVPQLPGSTGNNISPAWAISPLGDRVAGGLRFALNADLVKCDPTKKGWCDLQPRPVYKVVLGVYSVREETWKQYGDFSLLGPPAFSPDGKRIAFDEERGCTVAACDEDLMILDLETGQMKPVPEARSLNESWEPSWSPDGRFLAVTSNDKPGWGQIVVIDLATGAKKTIAEGTNPSWSPKGDWIAYASTVRCMIIHPDGTGARSVVDKQSKWLKYTLDAPILWSPDERRLLLNQRKIFGSDLRVIMVDLATDHVIMKSKNGEVVTGWVPYPGK